MFVTKKMPRSLSAEAYRSLRTSIKFSSVDKPIKTIVITSSLIGEGKSTVAGIHFKAGWQKSFSN